VAAAAIIGTAVINIRGVQLGAMVTGISSVAKFGALVVLVVAAMLLGGRAGASVDHLSAAAGPVTAGSFGLALISVLWAYDGFGDVSFVAGEVASPGRTLPRAIVMGTAAVVVIYLASNIAYLYVIPIDGVARSALIAADTMQAIFGAPGATFVSLIVTISTLGALNAIMMSAPRVFFAMAEDRLFFRPLAAVHPRYHTPYVAVLFAGALGVLFVMTRTFEQLADTFVLSIWPFYALAIAAVYRLRRLRPDLPRPYRVPGYPVVPAIFIAAAAYLIINALLTDPLWTAVTFGIILAGVPVYYVAFATKTNSTTKITKDTT
jgi:amino acid transporter